MRFDRAARPVHPAEQRIGGQRRPVAHLVGVLDARGQTVQGQRHEQQRKLCRRSQRDGHEQPRHRVDDARDDDRRPRAEPLVDRRRERGADQPRDTGPRDRQAEGQRRKAERAQREDRQHGRACRVGQEPDVGGDGERAEGRVPVRPGDPIAHLRDESWPPLGRPARFVDLELALRTASTRYSRRRRRWPAGHRDRPRARRRRPGRGSGRRCRSGRAGSSPSQGPCARRGWAGSTGWRRSRTRRRSRSRPAAGRGPSC